ncbi:MAG: DinB superfamily protein [Candidatus Angelobacter sp.]|nr:DinB superfamily protein [Candidatus Angelobacter sp.]
MNPVFAETLAAIDSATQGMTEEQLTYHPEGKWSTAQILEHLSLAFGGTAKAFERAFTEGKPLGDNPSFKQKLRDMLVLEIGYFPRGRTAPPMVTPKGEMKGLEALAKIRENLLRMDKAHGECQKTLSRERCIANHPVLGPLTFEQWPKFHRVHTLHHMKQVRALRLMQK